MAHKQAITENILQNHFPQVEVLKPDFVPLAKRFHLHLQGATHQEFFLADEITRRLEEFLAGDKDFGSNAANALRRLYRRCQEMLFFAEYTYALLRQKIGIKRIVRLHEVEGCRPESAKHYNRIKTLSRAYRDLPLFTEGVKIIEQAAGGRVSVIGAEFRVRLALIIAQLHYAIAHAQTMTPSETFGLLNSHWQHRKTT